MTAGGRGGGRIDDLAQYAGLFTLAVGAFLLAQAMGPRFGAATDLVAVAGNATCGWSWLVVRALFRPSGERREWWPLALVLIMVGGHAVLRLPGFDGTTAARMVENVSGLVSSALLLLAAIEPLTGLRRGLPRTETAFRLVFSASYIAVLAVAVLWVDGAPDGSAAARWGVAIKSVCAVLALAGITAAVRFRGRHPLATRARRAAGDTGPLGERVARLVADEAVFSQPGLKIGDVAKRLGEPEHRVTQAVTGALGFRNFNALINDRRIAEAKRRLADPAMDRLPILTVAYDCGFGSIGPFNRAFKAATGVTPQQYRRTAKAKRKTMMD